LSVTEHSDVVNGRKGYSSRDVNMRFGARLQSQMYGWLVGLLVVVGLHFEFKMRRIWVREEVKWVHGNGSYIFQTKVENSTKMADQLTSYQELLELERVPSPPSTAVSHNRALNALSDSRLARFVR